MCRIVVLAGLHGQTIDHASEDKDSGTVRFRTTSGRFFEFRARLDRNTGEPGLEIVELVTQEIPMT